MQKKAHIHLIYSPVLNVINYLVGVMTSSRSAKKGTTTLVDIIHSFRSQCHSVFGVEASIPSLEDSSATKKRNKEDKF